MILKTTGENANYLASIVRIESFSPHPNADRMKVAAVYGNAVITAISAEPGLYCYFPLECAISAEFISFNNGFVNPEMNRDKTERGYFESHGRVRAVRLRGQPSQGYIIPVKVLEDFIQEHFRIKFSFDESHIGKDFDTLNDWVLCKKYIPKGFRMAATVGKKTKGNIKKWESKIVEGQCHFHVDTAHLKRQVGELHPNDPIVISEKYHGTSFWVSNVLTRKKLSWKDKIAKFCGISVNEQEYGIMWGSRKVIKSSALDDNKPYSHFYKTDVWKTIADKLFPYLKVGYTFYGELVGYTPEGAMIQKGYDYGCSPNEMDYLIYRITFTNSVGDVFELSHDQMVEYCKVFGLKMPLIHYKGPAKDLFNIPTEEHWHENFLQKMIDTYLEKDCMFCKSAPNIPAEGVILRRDLPNKWDAYKLKSFRFLERESTELDSGTVDMETEESVE